jgi:hypothetical protein
MLNLLRVGIFRESFSTRSPQQLAGEERCNAAGSGGACRHHGSSSKAERAHTLLLDDPD